MQYNLAIKRIQALVYLANPYYTGANLLSSFYTVYLNEYFVFGKCPQVDDSIQSILKYELACFCSLSLFEHFPSLGKIHGRVSRIYEAKPIAMVENLKFLIPFHLNMPSSKSELLVEFLQLVENIQVKYDVWRMFSMKNSMLRERFSIKPKRNLLWLCRIKRDLELLGQFEIALVQFPENRGGK